MTARPKCLRHKLAPPVRTPGSGHNPCAAHGTRPPHTSAAGRSGGCRCCISTQHRCLPRCTNATPVGFEPTRGDPIGLAGRRLGRSAKVSAEVAKRTQAASMRAREHTAAPLLPGRAAAPASSLSNASDYVQQGQPAAGVELGKWLCSRLGRGRPSRYGGTALLLRRRTTPVGFEPTRGNPIGLAGRRLSRSAKVSPEGPQATTVVHKATILQYRLGFGPQRRRATMDQ